MSTPLMINFYDSLNDLQCVISHGLGPNNWFELLEISRIVVRYKVHVNYL